MKTRPLSRTDLPKKRISGQSLHIPVLFNGKKKFICDIHFADNNLCYLENGKGSPVQINKMQLIIDERSNEDIRNEIEHLKRKQEELFVENNKLQDKILKLKIELKNR